MEIEKIVEQKFNEIVKSGFIHEQIKNQLEKTIVSVINDCLREWSDFGKQIKEKVKKSLSLGNMNLKLPEYNQLVLNWVTEIINTKIVELGKKQIEKTLKDFFKPLEKEEYKISEIIERFKDSLHLDENETGEITFYINDDTKGYITYYFDEESQKTQYSCDYVIRTNKDGIWGMRIKETDTKQMKTPLLFNFESFMFQLYAQKIKIINDSENVDIELGYED